MDYLEQRSTSHKKRLICAPLEVISHFRGEYVALLLEPLYALVLEPDLGVEKRKDDNHKILMEILIFHKR